MNSMNLHESGQYNQKTVIFLHGNGASGLMWRRHFSVLNNFHCIAPDLPGFGKSNHLQWVSLDETADKIIAIIKQLDGERVDLVGLSLGGSLAFTLLGKRPDLFNHVIIDGAGVLGVPGLPVMKIGLYAIEPFLHSEWVIKTIAQAMQITQSGFPDFKTAMLEMSPAAFRRSFIQALSLKQPPGLNALQNRVLFVCGEKEPSTVLASNRMLARTMPNAQSKLAVGVGHGWMAQELELHCQMVKTWLTDLPLPPQLINNEDESVI